MPDESLRRCPKCGRPFANRNQTHTCFARHDLLSMCFLCDLCVSATWAVRDPART